MPSGEIAELTGGRVTRSLRKRLTSIDSDASSRPGTPNFNSLQAIPEINTPTKRLTRRASLSTPAANTPAKETTNTPGRRSTRRRSINISESEDNLVPIAKGPKVAVVKEEPESPKEQQPKRVLRSTSKSPNENTNTNTTKRTSKKPPKQEENDVIVLDSTIEEESTKVQSAKKKTRVSIKKDNLVEEEIEKQKLNSPEKKTAATEKLSPKKSTTKQLSTQKQATPEKSNSVEETTGLKTNKSARKESKPLSPLVIDGIKELQNSPNKKPFAAIRRLSLSTRNTPSPPLAQSTQKSPSKKNQPEPVKSVVFTESDDENDGKTVYPKTPGLVKSKSYILDGSNNVDKDETFKSKKDHSQSESEKSSDDDEKQEETATTGLDTKTPYKLKLLSVESSTPIQQKNNSPLKKNKSVEMQRGANSTKDYVFSDDDDDDEKEKISSFQKSWTPSVSGSAGNSIKIDAIVPENALPKKKTEVTSNKSPRNTSKTSTRNVSYQSKALVSDTSSSDDDEDVEKKEKVSAAQSTKSPNKSKAQAADKSTPSQQKSSNKSMENAQKKTPTKIDVVFSDDDEDDENQKKNVNLSSRTSRALEKSLTNKKEAEVTNKSRTNTPKKSTNKKSYQSKMIISDSSSSSSSSSSDEEDVADKKDKNNKTKETITEVTKSPLKTKSQSIAKITPNQKQNKSMESPQKKTPTKIDCVFSDDDDEGEKVTVQESSKTDGNVLEKSLNNKKEADVTNKSRTNTPKKSPKRKSNQSKMIVSDSSSSSDDDDAVDKKDKNNKAKESDSQTTKSPLKTKLQPIDKNKSIEIQQKGTPTKKDVVFSDDNDGEEKTVQQKRESMEIDSTALYLDKSLNNKKDEQVANKSKTNTPKNSPKRKSNQSKTIVSDSSSEDDAEVVGKKDNNKDEKETTNQITKSPLKTRPQSITKSTPNQQESSPMKKNKSIEIQQKGTPTKKDVVFSEDDSDQKEKTVQANREPLNNNEMVTDKSRTNTPKKSPKRKTYKSKMIVSDSSADDDDNEIDKKDNNKDEKQTTSEISKSPLKAKTPPPVEKDPPCQQNKETPTKAAVFADDEQQKAESFPKSWSQSVSGKISESTKIDCIVSEKSFNQKVEDEAPKKSQNNSTKKNSRRNNVIDSDTEEEEDLIDENDEPIDYDAEEEEENAGEKTAFIDDEAMEVAEGEESMDSEERAYLQENEIPEYGESIGSQDSVEEYDDDEDDDEQPDEDDAAFIVSDTEPIEELLSSEDEVEESKKQKQYKRITKPLESSEDENDDHAEAANKDDTDICLLVDSSFEDKDKDAEVSKSSNKSKITNTNESEENTSIKGKELRKSTSSKIGEETPSPRKSPKKSNSRKIIHDSDSESDAEEGNKNKPVIIEQIIIPPLKSESQSTIAPMSRKSVGKNSAVGDEDFEVIEEKSLNSSTKEAGGRKSLNTDSKSPSKKSRLSSLVRQDSIDDLVEENQNQLPDDESNNEKPHNQSGNKEKLNTSEVEVASKSRKSSFNESRKSLVRTSTEDENVTEEKTTLVLDVKESETEEASPVPESVPNTTEGKSQRRKSMSAQRRSIIEKENSTESQEEKPAENSNQPRKSICQPAQSSSDSAEEEIENNSSPEATDNEMESSRNNPTEAQFSDEDDEEANPDAANQTISSFLGEAASKQNSSRRKSIVGNDSKLDETFELDPKTSLSSSLHESLHRNVLKKALNQSQKRRQTIDVMATKPKVEDESSDSEADGNSSGEEEELKIKKKKKILSEKGLSVSLNSIQIKKKKHNNSKEVRNSFTIGVSLRMNSSDDQSDSQKEEMKAIENTASSSTNEDDHSDDNQDDDSSSSSSQSEGKLLNQSEEEVLENVKNVQNIGPYKSRKSMSILAPTDTTDVKQKKARKRTSLYLQDGAEASNSFVENLAEEKKRIKQQKRRKSNSFCGVLKPSVEDDDEHVEPPPEPRSEKKLKKSSESSSEGKKEVNLSQVLNRCEQMLEAANEAKRQAKMQAKKVKVKKPKWMDKEEKAAKKKEEEEVAIPLVSKKEIKRKEKLKKELERAIKHSAAVLTKVAEPVLKTKQKNVPSKPDTKDVKSSKRLDDNFLESLIQLSNPSKQKTKAIETTPPSDKENSKKKHLKPKYKIEDVHSKINTDIETLETACGTVIVEPSTPKKLRIQHGFRESPRTPAGFKVQDINSTPNKKSNQKYKSHKPYRKFKTSSGAFIEEDLKSKQIRHNSRKLPHITEPKHTLPRTQWTRSGVFYEEDLAYPRPLANSTATQFMVASLNSSGKKNNPSPTVVSSSTMNKALSFKLKAVKSKKNPRETSQEVLFAKQRRLANKQF